MALRRAAALLLTALGLASTAHADGASTSLERKLRKTLLRAEEKVELIVPASWPAFVLSTSPADLEPPAMRAGWLVVTSQRLALVRTDAHARPAALVSWDEVGCASVERYGAWRSHPHLLITTDATFPLDKLRLVLAGPREAALRAEAELAARIQRATAANPSRKWGRSFECLPSAPIVRDPRNDWGIPERVDDLDRTTAALEGDAFRVDFVSPGRDEADLWIENVAQAPDDLGEAEPSFPEMREDLGPEARLRSLTIRLASGDASLEIASATVDGRQVAFASIAVGEWLVRARAWASDATVAERRVASLISALALTGPSAAPPAQP